MNNSNEKDNPYSLDPMSEEQSIVYNNIKDGNNVIVDACAGSGKSTTILSIATNMFESKFVQLTYNSMLCTEIKEKISKLKLENLNVHTFHSLVVKYYTADGYTDTVIRRVLKKNTPPRMIIPKFNVLVIDEAQDMTFLYFKLVVKFCRDMGEPIQLLILGDFMQGLYEFKGADTRFLTSASKIWENFEKLKSPVFKNCTLKVSYRITQQMADFINNAMLGETRLYACKQGQPVVYLRRSQYNAEKYVIHKIKKLLEEGAKPSDFFVLGGSVKGEHSPIRRMENALVENNIPCHVPMFETDKIDERVIEGKVVFSTFHSVKGRQRKYVFVIGFDNSYFTYFARNISQHTCPNTLYVGCTRATHGLFVLERDEERQFNRPLKFLKMNHIDMMKTNYIDFQGIPQTIFYQKTGELDDVNTSSNNTRSRNGRELPIHYTTPTELIKFIPESVLEEIIPILDTIFVKISKENQKEIEIPSLIKTKLGFHEDVSDLNGIAIPMVYFEKLIENPDSSIIPTMSTEIENGGRVLKQIIENSMAEVKKTDHLFLRSIIKDLPEKCNTISDYLRTSNLYIAVKEKLYFKINQIGIDEYNWLSGPIIASCFSRIHETLGIECMQRGHFSSELERTIINKNDENIHKKIDDFLCHYFPDELFRFTARVDLVTEFCVWELKCTSAIVNDHLLQVIIYAWLWRMVVEDVEQLTNFCDFKIFNIKSGEILRLEATTEQLNTIIIALLKGKYFSKESKKDDDFINECKYFILGHEVEE